MAPSAHAEAPAAALAAADPAAICAAWTEFYFADADEAVRQYVCQALQTASEDEDSLTDQAAMLQKFLPPGSSQQALAEGLLQLDAALRRRRHDFGWLRQPEAGKAADPLESNQPKAAESAREQQQQQPVPPSPSPADSSSGGLSVAAAEFRPSTVAASAAVVAGVAPLQLDGGAEGWEEDEGAVAAEVEGCSGGWQDDGRYRTQGAVDASYEAGVGAAGASEAALAAEDAAAAAELVAGGPAAHAAFLAVLGEQFPLFSHAALRQLFEEQGGSLAATIHTLCSLEAEIQGQQAAGATGAQGAGAWLPDGTYASPSPEAAPAFTDDDFPTLGGPTASNTATGSASGRGTGGAAAAYASRARAAADLPAQPARRRPTQRGASPPPAAAPIWQQAEGVQRFSTGAALAAEYASLRSDARDHARLRNACFQQATQAYLAGDRRLAKELGARGRWHGEQMHAAHQAAASELFARRNPGAAGGSGALGSGSGGGMPTLDLHGLHVSEALQQLEALLLRMQGGGGRRVRVVVGRGTHGKVPARLPAAVRRWLQEQRVQFSEPYAGLLEIRL